MKSKSAYGVFVSLVLAVSLTGCGGGGGSSQPPVVNLPTGGTPASSPSAASSAAPASGASSPSSGNGSSSTSLQSGFNVVGSASSIAASTVTVIFDASALSSTGLSGPYMATTQGSGAAQSATSGGAFTTLAAESNALVAQLSTNGSVSDVAGNGQFAIGRWTAGQFTVTGAGVTKTQTIADNQGETYAVGIPLTLSSGSTTLTCTYVASTAPTSLTGTVAPGTINTGLTTASIALGAMPMATANISLNIGSDNNVSITRSSMQIGLLYSGSGSTFQTETVGSNASTPYLVVAYGGATPSSGDVHGIVVFSCQ